MLPYGMVRAWQQSREAGKQPVCGWRWGATGHDHWTETMPTVRRWGSTLHDHWTETIPTVGRWGSTLHDHWTETRPTWPGRREQMHVQLR